MPKFEVELKHLPGEEVCFVAEKKGNTQGDWKVLVPFIGTVLAVFPRCRENAEDVPDPWENKYLIKAGEMTFEVAENKITGVAKQAIAMCQDANLGEWK